MVSQVVLDDILDVGHKATDVLIDHLCDAMSDHGFNVTVIENFDMSIYISFDLSNPSIANIEGQLVVHRIDKSFEVAAKLIFEKYVDKSISYASLATRDFDEIERYLKLLSHDCAIYVERICLEKQDYEWRGLRFRAPA